MQFPYFITVSQPTTFFTSSKGLIILDSKRNPFYWHDNQDKHINFNLPPGRYYCNVPIQERAQFKPYNHEPYPKFTGSFLNDVQVYKHKNPNKASISLERRFILADPKFYNHTYRPLKTFTLCHEVFHRFFHAKTRAERKNPFIREYIERQCDNAAKNFMLANGWNPTQVSLAVKLLLRGKGRKDAIRKCTTDPANRNRR